MATGRRLHLTRTRIAPYHSRVKKDTKKLVTRTVRRRLKVDTKRAVDDHGSMNKRTVNVTLTYCSNYNGVYATAGVDSLTKTQEKAFDTIADTFPETTYKMVKDDWNHEFTDDQEQKLIAMAHKVLDPVFPDDTVVITFEVNDTDT